MQTKDFVVVSLGYQNKDFNAVHSASRPRAIQRYKLKNVSDFCTSYNRKVNNKFFFFFFGGKNG